MEPFEVHRRGAAAWCVLDRPPLNLFDTEVIAALRRVFLALRTDPTVRVAVLTGRGRAFAAGMDIGVMRDLDLVRARALITDLHDAIDAVHQAPFPVIARVNGPCLGAAFELALACDIRIASESATFGLPEVRVGIPSVIEAALLPALIGPGRAAEMLLTGASIGARQALAWGLVNEVVRAEALDEAVEAVTAAILACGPEAIRLQKSLMIRWRPAGLTAAIAAGIEAFVAAYTTAEPREGMTAFLERRAPVFVQPTASEGERGGSPT